jgi:hypothetical protein
MEQVIKANQHIRRMRGGAQSHLMKCEDGNHYVVKFQNNPQHRRVLANEVIATKLAALVGLPVPETNIIAVSDWLVEHTQELRLMNGGCSERCEAGLQFGAKFVIDPEAGEVFDYLPETMLSKVGNLGDFAGMLLIDKWTCNSDGRQVVFSRLPRQRKYQATFIDQGYCFNAGDWTFPDSPLRGVYARNEVYAGVTGWHSFEPWLSRIESMSEADIRQCFEGIPVEWHGDTDALESLIKSLYLRRSKVRQLVAAFRDSSRCPFPQWKEAVN